MVEEFWHFQACLFLSTVNCKLWRARIKMMMKECKLAGWGQTDGEDEGRVRLFHILLKFARQWDGEKDFDEDYARGGDNLKEMQKEKEDTSSFSYLVPHASKKIVYKHKWFWSGKHNLRTTQACAKAGVRYQSWKIVTLLEFLMKLALVQLASRCHCIPAGLPETALSKAPNLDTSSYRTKHSGQQAENRGERNKDLDVWWCCFRLTPGRKEEDWVAYGEVNRQKHFCIQCVYCLYRLNMSTYHMTNEHERTPGLNQMTILVC